MTLATDAALVRLRCDEPDPQSGHAHLATRFDVRRCFALSPVDYRLGNSRANTRGHFIVGGKLDQDGDHARHALRYGLANLRGIARGRYPVAISILVQSWSESQVIRVPTGKRSRPCHDEAVSLAGSSRCLSGRLCRS